MIGQTSFLQSLGWAILNSLWQLAALWILYQIITGLVTNARARFKSALATGLLITGFIWFVYGFFSHYFFSEKTTGFGPAGLISDSGNLLTSGIEKVLPFASVLYLAFLIIPTLRFIRNYRYVQVIRKFGLTKMDVNWRLFVTRIAARMNIRKKVTIWVSEFVSSPITIGFLKPVILVPLAAVNNLTQQQMEAVLLHELTHIRRRDYLINLLVHIIRTLLYFNPFVKAFAQIIEKEREKSCDEMVLQFQYDAQEYAEALLALEHLNRASQTFALALSGEKNSLLQRVEIILGIQKKQVFSFQKLKGVIACLLCIFSLNALLWVSGKKPDQAVPAVANSFAYSRTSTTPSVTRERILPKSKQNPQAAKSTFKAGYNLQQAASLEIPEASGFLPARFEFADSPELKKYQEEHVAKTLEASRKVLENMQWKQVESNAADAFSQKEKEFLKSSYEKQLSKMDWNKWEDRLRTAYNTIDWERVNDQLSVAIDKFRMDSIKSTYSAALSRLEEMSRELTVNNLKGIPDSDISIRQLEEGKAQLKKALSEIKALRIKKTIHL